ncbi:MAG: hypothetical protein AB7G17_07945 [Phycisphaerales bacterium]
MKKMIRRPGMARLVMLRALLTAAGLVGLVVVFALWGPHAETEGADAGGIAREWRALRDVEDEAGFEAWDAMEGAGERVKEFERARYGGARGEMGLALDRLLSGAWDDPRHGEDLKKMGERGALVEEILGAAERPFGSWRSPRKGTSAGAAESMMGAVFAEGFRERKLMGELLRVSMRENAARGDWESVERLTRGHLRLARHSFAGEGVVALGTAVSMWATGAEECARVAVEEGAPREVCERLARVIEEGRLPVEALARAVKGERWIELSVVRGMYNKRGYRMRWTGGSVETGGLAPSWGMLEEASAWDRVANARAYFEARLKEVEGDIEEGMGLLAGWAEVVAADEGDWEGMRREGERVRQGERALVHSLGGARGIVRMWLELEQARRGAMVALRVAGWRAERGEWPRGLEEVMEERERENPKTGREFVYVAGEEAGGGFWLMEVGLEEWKLGDWRGGTWRREYVERKKEEWEGE